MGASFIFYIPECRLYARIFLGMFETWLIIKDLNIISKSTLKIADNITLWTKKFKICLNQHVLVPTNFQKVRMEIEHGTWRRQYYLISLEINRWQINSIGEILPFDDAWSFVFPSLQWPWGSSNPSVCSAALAFSQWGPDLAFLSCWLLTAPQTLVVWGNKGRLAARSRVCQERDQGKGK